VATGPRAVDHKWRERATGIYLTHLTYNHIDLPSDTSPRETCIHII